MGAAHRRMQKGFVRVGKGILCVPSFTHAAANDFAGSYIRHLGVFRRTLDWLQRGPGQC